MIARGPGHGRVRSPGLTMGGGALSSTTRDYQKTSPDGSSASGAARPADGDAATCPGLPTETAKLADRSADGTRTVADPDWTAGVAPAPGAGAASPPRFLGGYEIIGEI